MPFFIFVMLVVVGVAYLVASGNVYGFVVFWLLCGVAGAVIIARKERNLRDGIPIFIMVMLISLVMGPFYALGIAFAEWCSGNEADVDFE